MEEIAETQDIPENGESTVREPEMTAIQQAPKVQT